eukprot:comp17339_c0_seq1/m.16565 comp17339_c0_seq1/g.16565  ORF comp17339_c0_seq1/g.16565 comp17339_c0_seq1/m.16565 type:complete len:456 (-) comp17339_c0_seq1:8-1375(-)
MVFSASLQAIGLANGRVPRQSVAQLRLDNENSVEAAQNEILTAVAKRTPADEQQVALQRQVGFYIGLTSLTVEPIIIHPFLAYRFTCMAQRGSLGQYPGHVFTIFGSMANKYGVHSLWRGFIRYGVTSTLCAFAQALPEMISSTIAKLQAGDDIQSKEDKAPEGGESENSECQPTSLRKFVWAVITRGAKLLLGLPFYASTVVTLAEGYDSQRTPMLSLLLRRFPGFSGISGKSRMFSLGNIALPYALASGVQDVVWDMVTTKTMRAMKDMQGARQKEPTQSKEKKPRRHSGPYGGSGGSSRTNNNNQSSNRDREGGDRGTRAQKRKQQNQGQSMLLAFLPDLAGSFAGVVVSETLTYPLWVVVNRMILQGTGVLIADRETGVSLMPVDTHYLGVLDCIATIYREEGPAGFFAGFGTFLCEGLVQLALHYVTRKTYRSFATLFASVEKETEKERM